VNQTPKKIVKNKATIASVLFTNAWWAHVTVPPDLNKIIEFKSGIPHGERGVIPTGGHTIPTLTSGLTETWIQVQNNPLKNITSDKIKRSIPSLIHSIVDGMWKPLDSELTSVNQQKIHIIKAVREMNKLISLLHLAYTNNLENILISLILKRTGHQELLRIKN